MTAAAGTVAASANGGVGGLADLAWAGMKPGPGITLGRKAEYRQGLRAMARVRLHAYCIFPHDLRWPLLLPGNRRIA